MAVNLITIEVADTTIRTRVVDAFCAVYNRPDTVKDASGNNIPNPVTKAAFASSIMRGFVKDTVKTYEALKAADEARVAAAAKAESEVSIT